MSYTPVRGGLIRGSEFRGRGGHDEHTSTSSTDIYSNALDTLGHTITSIVSVG